MEKKKLLDLAINKIAAVTRPANKRKWLIVKAEEGLPKKKEEDGEYPASDYAYVPEPDKSSTWKLRLTSEPGGDPDPRIVGAAVAALGKGFRGQKVQIPEEDIKAVKKKVAGAWRKANPDKTNEDMPTILKSEGGDGLARVKSMLDKASEMMQAAIDKTSKNDDMEKGDETMSLTEEQMKDLPEEVQRHIKDQEKELVEKDKQIEELSKSDKVEPEQEDIWKDTNPEIRKQFDAMREKAEEAEKIAKAEQEARKQRDFEDKAKSYSHIGTVEEVSKLIKSAYDISEENGKALEDIFSKTNTHIETNSILLKEIGGNGSDDGAGAWSKIQTAADSIVQKSDTKMTKEQAIASFLKTEEGISLYKQYRQEGSDK